MISVEYCQLLARYNHWMNERIVALAGEMTDEERKEDRGAFFRSIHRTLNHILWGDGIWLGRFTGDPYSVPAFGADMHEGFDALVHERAATDTRMLEWAAKLAPAWLEGTLEYRRASDGAQRSLPRWIAVTHLFAHATHHRGQVVTLMRQAGRDIGVTDLPWMPGIMK
jgi:uncharacterized damage-inducible protein DinB